MPMTPAGVWQRQNALFEAYIEAQEAGTVSDFPNFLAEKLHKILLQEWAKAPGAWRQYTKVMPFNDFKTHNVMTPLGETDDLLIVPESGGYAESQVRDSDNVAMALETFGRVFSISRQAIINDEFNKLQDQPARFGRAAARTLAKDIVATLETPGNAYDGIAFFGDHDSGNANNLMTSSGFSRTTLRDAIERMKQFKDRDGNRLGLLPSFLLVPVALEFDAREVLDSPILITGENLTMPNVNIMQNQVNLVVEPYLTSDTTWYLFGDPNVVPGIGAAFLNGKDTPDLMLKDPASRLVLGGNDPYSFEFDEISYKVRHDWTSAAIEPRGVIKATA